MVSTAAADSATAAADASTRVVVWRRWTGIEPAGRGSLVPAALKAVEPTRYPDTSAANATGLTWARGLARLTTYEQVWSFLRRARVAGGD